MEKKERKEIDVMERPDRTPVSRYVPPKIVTYTLDDLTEQIGPAYANISGQGPGCLITPS